MLLICLGCLSPQVALGNIPSAGTVQHYGLPATWGTDLDEAIGRARAGLRPMLVFFTAPNCLACDQLRRFSLQHDALQPLIRRFERVEIDLSKRPELATAFQVEQIPVLYVIEPDGRIKGHTQGYVTANALETYLRQMLEGDLPAPQMDRLVNVVSSGKADLDQWRKVLAAMEDSGFRSRIQAMSTALTPEDIRILVACLSDRQLAVRLGALDVLEVINDAIIGFDPWLDPTSGLQQDVLERWRGWSESSRNAPAGADTLTREKFERYIQDLIGEDPQRSRHALQVMSHGGEPAARFLVDYFQANPKLDTNALRRLKELQYSLVIPTTNGLDPQATAHQIVWGNQDVQIRTIRQLEDCGVGPAAILVDLLGHEDPLVRETAVEILFKAAGPLAVAPAEKLLESEKDPDICFAVLKHLGDINTPESQRILESYFTHTNEDLVVTAIEGAVQLSVGSLGTKMLPLLEDPRWRVRVAAIEAIKAKGGHESGFLDQLRGKKRALPERVCKALFKCLDDPDEFVRHTAAVALGHLKIGNAEGSLKKAYAKHPDMHGVIVSVLLVLDKSVPSAYIDELFGPKPDELLLVLDSVKEINRSNRELVHQAAASENPDIACSALRIIAGSEKRQASDNALLIKALQSGKTEKQLTVIQEFDLKSDDVGEVRAALKKRRDPQNGNSMPSGRTDADVLLAAAVLMDDPAVSDLVRSNTVILLCKFGFPGALAKAMETWSQLSASMRTVVAESLPLFGEESVQPFRLALDDDNTDVWQAALNHLSEAEGRALFAESVLKYLEASTGRLTLSMMWPEGLRSLCTDEPGALGPFAEKVLTAPRAFLPDRVILALATYAHAALPENFQPAALELAKDESPFIRRVAWLALVTQSADALEKHFESLHTDTSKYVRELIPALLYNTVYDDTKVTLYFSESEYFSDYQGLRINPKRSPTPGIEEDNAYEYDYRHEKKISQSMIARIKEMIADEPDPLVRLRCMLCLLSHRIPLDLNDVVITARSAGNPQRVADLMSDFFSMHIYDLGRNFRVLLPLLQASDSKYRYDYVVERFLKRWGGKTHSDDVNQLSFTSIQRKMDATPLIADFRDPLNEIDEQSDSPMELVLFTTSACQRCFVAEKMIQMLKYQYYNLRVRRYDLLTRQGLEYNEVLSRKFMVEDADRATVPTVFMAGGYLVDRDITFFSLDKLVSLSLMDYAGSNPLGATPEDLAAAKGFIRERRKGFSWFGILKSGFFKGVTPFTLVALLLVLYYLYNARRSGPSILRYGTLYLVVVTSANVLLWLLPQGDIRNGTQLHNIGGVLLYVILIYLLLIALRFFFRSFGRLRKKSGKPPRKHKSIKTPGRRYVVWVVVLWAVVTAMLDILCLGNAQTVTLAYSVKNQVSPFSSVLMLILFGMASMVPLGGILWGYAQLIDNARTRSFVSKHPFWSNIVLSGICFWMVIKFSQAL